MKSSFDIEKFASRETATLIREYGIPSTLDELEKFYIPSGMQYDLMTENDDASALDDKIFANPAPPLKFKITLQDGFPLVAINMKLIRNAIQRYDDGARKSLAEKDISSCLENIEKLFNIAFRHSDAISIIEYMFVSYIIEKALELLELLMENVPDGKEKEIYLFVRKYISLSSDVVLSALPRVLKGECGAMIVFLDSLMKLKDDAALAEFREKSSMLDELPEGYPAERSDLINEKEIHVVAMSALVEIAQQRLTKKDAFRDLAKITPYLVDSGAPMASSAITEFINVLRKKDEKISSTILSLKRSAGF